MHSTVIMRSVIKSRRKNIRTTNEHTQDEHIDTLDYDYTPYTQYLDKQDNNTTGDHNSTTSNTPTTTTNDPRESLPIEQQSHLDSDESNAMDDQLQIEDDHENGFDNIVDYYFDNVTLIFKVKYTGDTVDKIWNIPFNILKNDAPYDIAKFIKTNVSEIKRLGTYATWEHRTILSMNRRVIHLQSTSTLLWSHYKRSTVRATKTKQSRNTRTKKKGLKTKFGIQIPKSVKQALHYDKINGNNKWKQAIDKEMKEMEDNQWFQFKPPGTKMNKEEGWQFSPLHMSFDIKKEDLMHKARLVVGGHVIDASDHMTYTSTVQ